LQHALTVAYSPSRIAPLELAQPERVARRSGPRPGTARWQGVTGSTWRFRDEANFMCCGAGGLAQGAWRPMWACRSASATRASTAAWTSAAFPSRW
jgi:hypothetical protein